MRRLHVGEAVIDGPNEFCRLLRRERVVKRVRRRHGHESARDIVFIHPLKSDLNIGEPLVHRNPIAGRDAGRPKRWWTM